MITYNELMIICSAGIAAKLYVNWKFNRQLKNHHPAEWEEFERLRLTKSMLPDELRHFKYFAARKYRGVGDAALTRLGNLSIAMTAILLSLLILAAVLFP